MTEQSKSFFETIAKESALNLWQAYCDKKMEVEQLKEVNAELLEALKLAQTIIGFGKEWDQIDAAIAKAEESK
jgi:hypothetical protein